MDEPRHDDIPYGNDWDSTEEAAAFADEADRARPWRVEIRNEIARRIATLPRGARILELGSGPGLLARRVLETCPNVAGYTLLDFSEPMLALSRERLAAFPIASYVCASFKSENWPRYVGAPFDCVVSMQAVHELRNKRHARRLYEQVYGVLVSSGQIMICDHTPFDDSLKSTTLYMTEEEQQDALTTAGFTNVRVEMRSHSLRLYIGYRAD